MTDLYEYSPDHIGRKTYVSVRGHSRSIPKYKTYRAYDGLNRVLPEYGGEDLRVSASSPYIMPDKAGYLSPLDFGRVEGRSAHREHMKQHGVVEAGDMRRGDFKGSNDLPSIRESINRSMAELN